MFTAELWEFFGVIVAPLIGVLIAGVVYWLRKLDDRQYQIAVNSVTRADLIEALRPINERLIRMENRMHGQQQQSSPRWRSS